MPDICWSHPSRRSNIEDLNGSAWSRLGVVHIFIFVVYVAVTVLELVPVVGLGWRILAPSWSTSGTGSTGSSSTSGSSGFMKSSGAPVSGPSLGGVTFLRYRRPFWPGWHLFFGDVHWLVCNTRTTSSYASRPASRPRLHFRVRHQGCPHPWGRCTFFTFGSTSRSGTDSLIDPRARAGRLQPLPGTSQDFLGLSPLVQPRQGAATSVPETMEELWVW